jgi:GNAT superfamily N-acetyltransferase
LSRLRPVEALDPGRHPLADFECGRPVLDRWLRAYAGQAQRRDVARTFVGTDEELRVVGYYTLVAGQVEHAAAPDVVRTGVSRHYPIPVCVLARLAVTTSWQGQGLGSHLLRNGLGRILAAAEEIGLRAALVDAIDEEAGGFYRRYGFEPATADGLTLMVPLAAVRTQLLER